MRLIIIDISGWPVSLRLVLLIVPFLLLTIGIIINVYIACSGQFNVMCRAFGRSRGLEDEVLLWGTTRLRSRMLIVSAMSLAFIWPSLGLRRGWLDLEDSNEFPNGLRCSMKLSSYCLLVGLGVLFFLTSFVKVTSS